MIFYFLDQVSCITFLMPKNSYCETSSVYILLGEVRKLNKGEGKHDHWEKKFIDSEFLHLGHKAVISDSFDKWEKPKNKQTKKQNSQPSFVLHG